MDKEVNKEVDKEVAKEVDKVVAKEVDMEVSQSNDPEMDPRKSPCLTRRDKLPMSSSLATEPSVVSVALPQSSVWMSPKHSWWQSSYKVDLEP